MLERNSLVTSDTQQLPETEGVAVDPLPPGTHTIRYRGFHSAQDSFDRFNTSDEIYIITSAVHIDTDGQNIVRTVRHPVSDTMQRYGDVDTDETRLGPIAACWLGSTVVMSLTVIVFENDDGDPDAYREEVHNLVVVALLIASYLWPGVSALLTLEAFSEFLTDFFNWFLASADDELGTETQILTRGQLDFYSRSSLDEYVGSRLVSYVPPEYEDFLTGLHYHFLTNHQSGAHYVVGFDVTRNPPFNIPEDPQGGVD